MPSLPANLLGLLAQAKRTLGENRESTEQFVGVLHESRRYQFGFAFGRETLKADEKNAGVNETLAEKRVPQNLCQRLAKPSSLAGCSFVLDTWSEFRNRENIVPIDAKPFDDLSVDVLVRNNFQPATGSTG